VIVVNVEKEEEEEEKKTGMRNLKKRMIILAKPPQGHLLKVINYLERLVIGLQDIKKPRRKQNKKRMKENGEALSPPLAV
jgi:hypothetical protein